MRVLFLVHGLPVGGTEMMVVHLVRSLRSSGIDVVVGCLDAVGELGEELLSEGVAVEVHGRRPGLDPGLPFRIARTVKSHRCDLVHAHQYTCFFYGALARLLHRRPLVFTEHGRFFPDVPSSKRRAFNRVFHRLANRITAVSAAVKRSLDEIERIPARRIEVIYNGLDLERFARSRVESDETRASLGIGEATRVIGTVGRLDPIKNHELLLAAFRLLAEEIADSCLVIVGEGPTEPKLREWASSLGIESKVRFLGRRHDVHRLMATFDVFALSSFSEGTPMTIIEAMAASVPVVSTAVGGIPEILQDGIEGLLAPGVPPELARPADMLASEYAVRYKDLLTRVLVDSTLAESLSRKAYDRARREFSLDAISRRYRRIYRELTPASPRSESEEGIDSCAV